MRSLAVRLMLMALLGCARSIPPPPSPVSPDSPLAGVQIGMGMNQVVQLLGQPTDTRSHLTGKSFALVYFGDDAVETAFFYAHVGRVIFAGGAFQRPVVIRIEENRNEPGY